MGVAANFETFCSNMAIDNTSTISDRYKTIAKRLNTDFWNSDSESSHIRQVGSYGRGTAIKNAHDVDVLFQLPYATYVTYHNHAGNGQSALLQAVRTTLLKTYWNTSVSGDGQVVVVKFSDSMKFEVLPAFLNDTGSYTHPDSNDGGKWKITNPVAEIAALNTANNNANSNLKRLCKMARAWRRHCDVLISGMLIDTLAEKFIEDWSERDKSYLYYDWMGRDFFEYLAGQPTTQQYWLAFGSGSRVYRKGNFETKAQKAYETSLEAIKYDSDNMPITAAGKWREIYGSFYPTP